MLRDIDGEGCDADQDQAPKQMWPRDLWMWLRMRVAENVVGRAVMGVVGRVDGHAGWTLRMNGRVGI